VKYKVKKISNKYLIYTGFLFWTLYAISFSCSALCYKLLCAMTFRENLRNVFIVPFVSTFSQVSICKCEFQMQRSNL